MPVCLLSCAEDGYCLDFSPAGDQEGGGKGCAEGCDFFGVDESIRLAIGSHERERTLRGCVSIFLSWNVVRAIGCR